MNLLSSLAPRSDRSRIRLVYVFLALLVVAVYGQTARYEFMPADDEGYVTGNGHVRQGLTLEGIRHAFTSTDDADIWHPVTWLSHMADVQLFGVRPGPHHVVNVFFHAANSLLLFHVLLGMTGALRRSAFVAAAFAVHPLHVESVAWICERKDLLSAFFFLLTLRSWTSWVRSGSPRAYGSAILCHAMGLMAKPMVVTAPFVLLLLDCWPFGRIARCGTARNDTGADAPQPALRRLLIEKLPFLILSAASSVITYVAATGRGGAVGELPLYLRLANATRSYLIYLRHTAWPDGLAVFYPHPGDTIPPWETVLGLLLLSGITATAIRFRAGRPWLPAGWLWYLGTLVPVVGIVQVGKHSMADRYMYLPSIGLFVILAWGGAEIAGRLRHRRLAAALPLLPLLALLAMTVAAWHQTGYWKDETTLLTRALEIDPENAFAHQNLASASSERGDLATSLRHQQEAMRIEPDNPKYAVNFGITAHRLRRPAEAEQIFREVVQAWPDYAPGHLELGRMFALRGMRTEAIAEYREVLRIDPGNGMVHRTLGQALAGGGNVEEGLPHLREAVKLTPGDPNAWYYLGVVLDRVGQPGEAIPCYREAIALRPAHVPSHVALGLGLAATGNREEAILVLRSVVDRVPQDESARRALETLLAGSPPPCP